MFGWHFLEAGRDSRDRGKPYACHRTHSLTIIVASFIISSDTHFPRTIWAQDKHSVFVTFEVFEAKDVEVVFEKDRVRFTAVQEGTNQKFALDIQLYDDVKAEECTQFYTPRAIKCTLEKANAGPFWPRLLKEKTKPHYLGIDFSRWVDEDYEDEDPAANAPFDPAAFMNMAQMGGPTGAYSDDTSFAPGGEPPLLEDSSDEEGTDGMPALVD